MKAFIKSRAADGRRLLRHFGVDLVRYADVPVDFDDEQRAIYLNVAPFTMTGPLRIQALVESVRYLTDIKLEGAFVECGVRRGGSMMAAALTLLGRNCTNRELYLFDTFEGMTMPGEQDRDLFGVPAAAAYRNVDKHGRRSEWCEATTSEVEANLGSTGYPPSRVHLVKGRVEDSIPSAAPDTIALLRLDTDWYSSTKHEMEHLFTRLVPGGVLLLDDYGHWQGSRRAVDEYLDGNGLRLLLQRIDYTGRIALKP